MKTIVWSLLEEVFLQQRSDGANCLNDRKQSFVSLVLKRHILKLALQFLQRTQCCQQIPIGFIATARKNKNFLCHVTLDIINS